MPWLWQGRSCGEEGLFNALTRVPLESFDPARAPRGVEGAGDGAEVGAEWVASVTTVSTPHDGTPLVPMVDGWVPFVARVRNGQSLSLLS